MNLDQMSFPVLIPSKEMPPMYSPVRPRGISSPGNVILSAIALVVSMSAPLAAQTTPEVMYACYVPLTGTVYRIKTAGAPSECTKPKKDASAADILKRQDHIEFTFNAQVQGPVGPAGAVGLTGPMGPAGPQGEVGPMGPAGPQGDVGPMGQKGDVGATGATGPQGVAGPMGATGAQGATGPQGQMGMTGAQGPQGIPGVSGYVMVQKNVSAFPNSTTTHTMECPTGKKVFGGGFYSLDGAA